MNPNNNIKLASIEDFKRLKEIGMNCYEHTVPKDQQSFLTRFLFWRYFSKRKFKERQRLDVLIYCLEVNGTIMGFYELEQTGCLSSLYVHQDGLKKGYGKALLLHSLKEAKRIGLKEVYLDASQFAHDFYKHFGFKDTKKPKVLMGVWMVPMKIKVD